ncbi:MAG: class I SAM-dependent methyltransferase [Opitutaceae bacterium]|nr:class I SAM-dependent methyltransferase [Opitutaceae bacterium]
MNTTQTAPAHAHAAAIDETRLQAFLGRTVDDLSASYVGVMVSLGRRLGLYRTLAGSGPLSSHEIAHRSGCAERYVREWLNSQVATGYILYHPSSATYELPPEHAAVLADEESPLYLAPAWEVPASMWLDQERTLEVFRTGEGVPWSAHNERLYCGVSAFYRNCYKGQLVPQWLPALEGAADRLRAGARVADVGCGHGHSTILLAEAFPRSRFHGFDTHEGSIAAARENAVAAGVAARTEFTVTSAKDYPAGPYDMICFFDCLHDMGDPVGAATHARACIAEDGMVMVIEPLAHDAVENNVGSISRLYYGASTALCCPHSRSEEVGLALGAQAGPARLREVFQRAGFTRFRVAQENPFNLILEVRP